MKTNSSVVIVPSPAPATPTNVAAAEDIRDIKAPVEILSGWAWLWWTLSFLTVAAIAYALIRYWIGKRASEKAPTMIIPPHVRARQRLREALELIHQPRPFCILVSDTLRVYLEERFHLRAPERTTEEFLEELQSSALLSMAQKQSLGDFLMRCDLVKFARYEPVRSHLQELYDSALQLIEETASSALSAPSVEPASPTHAGVQVDVKRAAAAATVPMVREEELVSITLKDRFIGLLISLSMIGLGGAMWIWPDLEIPVESVTSQGRFWRMVRFFSHIVEWLWSRPLGAGLALVGTLILYGVFTRRSVRRPVMSGTVNIQS
jgi:hypothetical protein